MLVEAGGAGEDVEIEEMGEGEELHDDAIAMLFLIAEHNNPASKSAPRYQSNSAK